MMKKRIKAALNTVATIWNRPLTFSVKPWTTASTRTTHTDDKSEGTPGNADSTYFPNAIAPSAIGAANPTKTEMIPAISPSAG